jgi:hypothetical protein
MKSLLPLILLLSSCTVHPFAYNPTTGEYVSNGASVLTKSLYEDGYARTSSGTELAYRIQGKDETYLPKAYFWEKGISTAVGHAAGSFRTAESSRRILGQQSVNKLGIRAARDVRLAEIAVPAEVPIIPTVPVP